MKKSLFGIALGVGMVFALGTVATASHEDPPSGKHFNLNIIGFAQCKKNSDDDPDCFKGNSGDIATHGHVIFVPLVTAQVENICITDGTILDPDVDGFVDVAKLKKGVRILVSDGDKMQVIDRDATDGTARFTLPDGEYKVFARPLGKPGGCMDIDTLICFDADGVVQQDCDTNLNSGQTFVLVGHIDVNRTTGKQHWQKVTDELLPALTGTDTDDFFDFFWQIFNDNLRLLQLRFYCISGSCL